MSWRNDQVSELETEKILSVAKDSLVVSGDFVELGCYKGDTSMLLAEVIKQSCKRLFIYDSFEGLPEKSSLDASEAGRDFVKGVLLVTKREIKARFLRAGMKLPVIKKAWFNELADADLPEKIAFAFLDGDLYESICDSLKLVEGKLSEGAVVIIHDYQNEALPGVAKAVDEWLAQNPGHKTEVYQSMMIIRHAR